MIRNVCFFRTEKNVCYEIESVLQTKNRSEPAKNRFSVTLVYTIKWEFFASSNFREISRSVSIREN